MSLLGVSWSAEKKAESKPPGLIGLVTPPPSNKVKREARPPPRDQKVVVYKSEGSAAFVTPVKSGKSKCLTAGGTGTLTLIRRGKGGEIEYVGSLAVCYQEYDA